MTLTSPVPVLGICAGQVPFQYVQLHRRMNKANIILREKKYIVYVYILINKIKMVIKKRKIRKNFSILSHDSGFLTDV